MIHFHDRLKIKSDTIILIQIHFPFTSSHVNYVINEVSFCAHAVK